MTGAAPPGGHLPQEGVTAGRAVFTDAYALIPREVLRGIVTSRLPGWQGADVWILARPMSGFAETFAQYVVALAPGGGSDAPEPEPAAVAALYVLDGALDLTIAGDPHRLGTGGFAYVPPHTGWTLRQSGDAPAHVVWIRKLWQRAAGLAPPAPIVTHEGDLAPEPMAGSDGAWTTTRFMDPDDLSHDMAVTVVTLAPGARIPFAETHVMEHGLYVLEGRGVYLLNRDWHEVGPGDFLWLRAFCPQGCVAAGPGPFRYLLYKDVNRHPPLSPP